MVVNDITTELCILDHECMVAPKHKRSGGTLTDGKKSGLLLYLSRILRFQNLLINNRRTVKMRTKSNSLYCKNTKFKFDYKKSISIYNSSFHIQHASEYFSPAKNNATKRQNDRPPAIYLQAYLGPREVTLLTLTQSSKIGYTVFEYYFINRLTS